MRVLLDTHVLLWWLADDDCLSPQERQEISEPHNMVYVSAASIWEIAIKRKLGKLEIPDSWFEAIAEEPFRRLPITWEHAVHAGSLPEVHRDPFDRLLIAQALDEDLTVLTRDKIFGRYGVSVLQA